MAWDEGLLPEQRTAAGYSGSHARLLAGPGTGKTLTLTRHICYLVIKREVPNSRIMALTFTRAAARELKQRAENELGKEHCPHICTLHSFALRQLLKNTKRIAELPQPLRIADDWEERNIILEELKTLLKLQKIKDARALINELSADWQSLTADEADWEKRFPNARFLGIWREHRKIYGYTLRSELVYQLKKALKQRGDFELEGPLEYLLIDEYQDLNRCDLAVVEEIASRNVELFIAGDDDQSIYGFRKAHPEGIRRFPSDFEGSKELMLKICKRCDKSILGLGLFVAEQDARRFRKEIIPENGRAEGEVALLRFPNQDVEAVGITWLCYHLISGHRLIPEDILILIRSDHYGVFSDTIYKGLASAHIPVSVLTEKEGPLDGHEARAFLSFMRLAVSPEDNFAWRTLLQVWCNGIGGGATGCIYELARANGNTFAQTIFEARADNEILPSSYRGRLAGAIDDILSKVAELFPGNPRQEYKKSDELMTLVSAAAESLIKDASIRNPVLNELRYVAESSNIKSFESFVRATEVASEDLEQEIEKGKVNILTMHRAKGLTAKAVIIAAAEDQYIPGRARGNEIDDERRLLYVSLTRAKHHLFITYCDNRTGPQKYTGRDTGKTPRSLSRFLIDCPHDPENGVDYIKNLVQAEGSPMNA